SHFVSIVPCVLSLIRPLSFSLFFFFNAPAPTETYTLSLHDALPILSTSAPARSSHVSRVARYAPSASSRGNTKPCLHHRDERAGDRKSTRLNSSHVSISYAVFCLKKKNKKTKHKKITNKIT